MCTSAISFLLDLFVGVDRIALLRRQSCHDDQNIVRFDVESNGMIHQLIGCLFQRGVLKGTGSTQWHACERLYRSKNPFDQSIRYVVEETIGGQNDNIVQFQLKSLTNSIETPKDQSHLGSATRASGSIQSSTSTPSHRGQSRRKQHLRYLRVVEAL